MADVPDEMALVQQEIEQADEALRKAMRERVAARGGDSLAVASFEAAVTAAKNALTDAEIKLRKLYESKDDGG
jgi:outer membrane protein TolC